MNRLRYLAGFLALVLVGYPFLSAPVELTGVMGALAALLCLGGIARGSTRLLASGVSLGLIEYVLALWVSPGPPDYVTPLGLGVAVFLLFEVVGFAARFRGVAIDPLVLRDQVRYWVGTGALAVVTAIALAVAAGGVTLGLPLAAYPAAAALGALVTLVGTVRVLTGQAGPTQANWLDQQQWE